MTSKFLASSLLLLAGCGGEPAPAPQIRIGLLALLSGMPAETSGKPSIEGAQLAVQRANERGGVLVSGVPHAVELVVEGYEDRPDSATSVARALINQSRIDVLVGPQLSRHAIPVALVAEDAQIPMVTPLSSSPATTKGKKYVFRLAFLDEVQGRVMGEFAANDLGVRRASVLYDVSTDYSRSIAESFRGAFEKEGGRVVAFEAFARDEPMDYREQLAVIAAARPDVLLLPNDGERVEAQILQSREIGVAATLLGSDTWDLELVRRLGGTATSYVVHQWHPDLDTEEARGFRGIFEKTYGKPPKVTAAMSYDAVNLVLEVIAREGTKEASRIRDGLARTHTFTGATGTIHYPDGPDPRRSVVIIRIAEEGSFLHKIVDPAASQP